MSERDPLETSPLAERLAYFAGRLLGPDDLGAEQTYHRGRLALALRALVGHGTVAGLRVTAADGRVHVAPGVAIDCLGRLIEVRAPLCLDLAGWTLPSADLLLHADATATGEPAVRLTEGARLELVPALEAATVPPLLLTPDAELEAVLDGWDPAPRATGLLLARIAFGDVVTVDNTVRPFVRRAGR